MVKSNGVTLATQPEEAAAATAPAASKGAEPKPSFAQKVLAKQAATANKHFGHRPQTSTPLRSSITA
ncbi:hypothetical protein CKM354_001103200 [Cercospora kikuchii]|uniref:Uncharacterized protein n=1 Tax=Cercospora kikuchii TaxID=84275 RepID=A0A9P3FK30_9PEZI|nr:uncharacterized protein CKM354_001103200 [Cercospora kikuchii]GIZ47957.1 hypothetical protein CKM354_001103200 [Cercospora kikuchii]